MKLEDCPVKTTVDVIGGKWKPLILFELKDAPLRFSELRRRIPGATQKMLTQQLRELEKDGVLHRRVYAQVPPKVEYSLTRLGRTLIEPLHALCRWSEKHLAELQANRARAKATREGL
jgi:DNA-binding HxlR family transcriptional regulator